MSEPTPPRVPQVHLVIRPHGGLAAVHLDGWEHRAHDHARVVRGVVVSLPVSADYRDPHKATMWPLVAGEVWPLPAAAIGSPPAQVGGLATGA